MDADHQGGGRGRELTADDSPDPAAIALAAIAAIAIAQGVGRFALTPLLPDMQAAAALGFGGAGLVAAANFAGYLAGSLLLAARSGAGRFAPVQRRHERLCLSRRRHRDRRWQEVHRLRRPPPPAEGRKQALSGRVILV